MARRHYGVAFSCNISAFEILLMFACFGFDFLHLWIVCRLKLVEHLVTCSYYFYSCVKFILQLKLVGAKSLHDLILIYFITDHLFL
jgi:hypothetical protein